MKLSKLYAEGGEFHDVEFNPGLNVVLGSCTRRGETGADQHNLGKTLFVDVVDFALLSNVATDHAFKTKATFFKDHVFYLEVEAEEGVYVTVKRSVSNMGKASFLVTHEPVNARDVGEWTHKDVSLAARSGVNARELLKTLLKLDAFESMSLRSLLTYTFRRQDDYVETFNINNENKLISWLPRLMDFVGLDGQKMHQKLKLNAGINAFREADRILTDAGVYDSPEIESTRRKIVDLRAERERIEQSVGSVSFFDEDEKISRSVVKGCDAEISKRNVERYKLQFDIDKLSRFVENEYIDLDEINAIYQEAELMMPDTLVKSYEELVEFNRQVWADRQGFVERQIEEMGKKRDAIDGELIKLDEQRKGLLTRLKRQDVVERYKKKRLRIAEIDSEIDSLKGFLSSIIDANSMMRQQDTLKEKLKEDVLELKEMSVVATREYAEFAKGFHSLVNDMLGKEIKLTFSVNRQGNINFDFEFKDKDGDKKLLHKGTTYRKMLSICFDIALLLKYLPKQHMDFVVHDGVWDTLGDILKGSHLRVLRELSAVFDCQFVITILDDDVPKENKLDEIFDENEIILRLDDREDDSGLLFKAQF